MRIVFMGTPDFSVPTLEALVPIFPWEHWKRYGRPDMR